MTYSERLTCINVHARNRTETLTHQQLSRTTTNGEGLAIQTARWINSKWIISARKPLHYDYIKELMFATTTIFGSCFQLYAHYISSLHFLTILHLDFLQFLPKNTILAKNSIVTGKYFNCTEKSVSSVSSSHSSAHSVAVSPPAALVYCD